MDPANITQTITLVKHAIDASKSLSNLEIKDALIAAREALNDQREANLALQEQNQLLAEKLKTKNTYLLERSVYWEARDESREQPFCPVCYVKDRIVPLQRLWTKRDKKQTLWHCPDSACNATFNPWDWEEYSSSSYDMSLE